MGKIILCLITAVFLIVGCATTKMSKNNEGLLKLEMGMTKDKVMNIMGKPDLNEAYQSLYGKEVIIYFYYTQRKWQDGNVTKDECTPVIFENGKLVGWGDEFYRNKIEVDVNIKKVNKHISPQHSMFVLYGIK